MGFLAGTAIYIIIYSFRIFDIAIGLFDQTLAQGIRQGQVPGRTTEARNWFRNTAKKLSSITETRLLANKTAITNQIQVGRMYMFQYDPKYKKTLPYYDMFPLIFPLKKTPDGFIGINLHYLPPVLRAKLMDMLYPYVNDANLSDNAKLNISYNILNAAATNKYIKPCIKQYLTGHLRSKFIYIVPAEWDIALFLPVENFAKASKDQVWKDSKQIINRGSR